VPLYRRALAIRERALGPDHPALLGPLVGLAELHLALGRPAAARPLLERALPLARQPAQAAEVQALLDRAR
jgi:hypothetical protein